MLSFKRLTTYETRPAPRTRLHPHLVLEPRRRPDAAVPSPRGARDQTPPPIRRRCGLAHRGLQRLNALDQLLERHTIKLA